MQSTILAQVLVVGDAFTNESYKTKCSEGIGNDKITMLEARVRVIKGVDLYNLVQAVEICLSSNKVVPKKLHVPEFIKYLETQYHVTHLKSYYNKMEEVM